MAMTTVRTAVEVAIAETAARLRGALATWPQTAHATVIRDAARTLATRSQQLAQLPELPMRITEAEDLKDLAERITRTAVKSADQKLCDAIGLAVQPVRAVLRDHAVPENGRLRFPEERDLPPHLQHAAKASNATASGIRRLKDSLRALFSSHR